MKYIATIIRMEQDINRKEIHWTKKLSEDQSLWAIFCVSTTTETERIVGVNITK